MEGSGSGSGCLCGRGEWYYINIVRYRPRGHFSLGSGRFDGGRFGSFQ